MDHGQRVMLIMGGSGSIGSVIAEQAVLAGWAVAVHGRSDATAGAVVRHIGEITNGSAIIKAFSGDIMTAGTIERLVEDVGAWRGRIDAVVHCAAAGPNKRLTGPFVETDADGYAALLDFSIGSFQRISRASLPWLQREGGALIAFASDSARFAAPGQSMIGASRAAIIGFVRNLAMDVARAHVRVHCVSLGYVDQTAIAHRLADQNALRLASARRRAGLGLPTPRDIAPLILFLCGEGAERITGQVISVNGGLNA